MRTRSAFTVVALAALAGCASNPPAAKTKLTGGESRLFSEREERRPVVSSMTITAESAPLPVPPPQPPTIVIQVTPATPDPRRRK